MQRTLSPVERLLWLVSPQHPVNFAMVATINGPLEEDHLRRGLTAMQQRHPLLGVRIVSDPTHGVGFVSDSVAAIPLQRLEREDSQSWIAVVEQDLPRQFGEGPLIRCIWLQGEHESDLIFVCAHMISDGLSVVYLIRDLLQYLAQPSTTVLPLPALPPAESLIPPEIVSRLIEELAHGADQAPPSASDVPPRPKTTGSMPTQVINWVLPETETDALIARCRAEQTTVHGAIGAAFLMSYAAQPHNAGQTLRRIQSPVNLRQRLSQKVDDHFGLFVILVEAPIACVPDDDFWEVARCVRQELQRIINSDHLFLRGVALTSLVTSQPAEALDHLLSNRPPATYDLSITNLGDLSRRQIPDQYGELRLRAIHGPVLHTGDYETVLGINTFNGTMSLTLASADAVQADALRKQAMDRLHAALA